jgi:MFS family permease
MWQLAVPSRAWAPSAVLLGLALGVVFLWVETRAAEPIVPLDLFRNRTYTASMVAAFLASFGFFGAIIFLPRWYQVVAGSSATESGYQLLPLLGGVILGSVLSGQIVSRTGRYKRITVGALVLLAIGLVLMTQLRADTPPPMLWAWQFIAGLGIGPTLAVFTIIVQNAVPWQKLGVATSNLTFFRQVGGTVGLAMAGTIFGATFKTETPRQIASELAAAGVPPEQIAQFSSQFDMSGAQFDELSAVGDMGARILAQVPAELRPFVEPLVPSIVQGIHEAFSLAIANTMWLGVVAAVVATAAALTLREVALRRTHQPAGVAGRPASAAAEARALE